MVENGKSEEKPSTSQKMLWKYGYISTTFFIPIFLQESIDKFPRNVMWNLPEQRLFESIQEGHVEGFNQEVLTNLIRFYLIKPTVSSEDVDNKDYLGEAKYLHNLKNQYNRNYAFKTHRHVFSNRPRHYEKPEISE